MVGLSARWAKHSTGSNPVGVRIFAGPRVASRRITVYPVDDLLTAVLPLTLKAVLSGTYVTPRT